MPVPLPPSGYDFAIPAEAGDLVGTGADLEPATLLDAYRCGLFPMGVGERGRAPMGWWSPDPRGVLFPADLVVSRSLRRSLRRFDVSVDTAPEAVIAGCADPRRDGAWITDEVAAAYLRLFRLGWVHTVEVWRGGELVGGLYGVCLGGLFAGESMFHRATDASKVALVTLVDLLREDDDPRRLIDVQWSTSHLATLGVVEVPRARYLGLLSEALATPLPQLWRSAGSTA